MVDLAKFTTTSRTDFEQLARDRKEDFEALQREQRWTASVYLGPYIVEARLKAKICEQLNQDMLPAIFKTHDLIVLTIYAGLTKPLETVPRIFENLRNINTLHREAAWRYQLSNPAHQVDSNKMWNWLFDPPNGVMTWLGL